MLRTVLIFTVIIVAAVALLPRGRHPSPAPVDYAGPLQAVRAAAPFPVLAPAGLPPGWVATNVRTHVPGAGDPTCTFHLGFYAARIDSYAAYDQTDAAGAAARILGPGARQTGLLEVAGLPYQVWADSSGRQALVRPAAGGSELVITGRGRPEALRELAASLH